MSLQRPTLSQRQKQTRGQAGCPPDGPLRLDEPLLVLMDTNRSSVGFVLIVFLVCYELKKNSNVKMIICKNQNIRLFNLSLTSDVN